MADIQVTNTDSDLSGNTLLTEEEAYTITGLHTYNRSTNPPFAVASGAAKVDNLDADKLDGQTGTYYAVAANVLLKDGSVALTANWDAGGYEIRSNTFESDVATGTAPLTIASTPLVTNLNADILDGQQGSYYLAAANATGTLSVAQGGTGATSLTDGGILLGSGTGAVTALGVAANGQIPIGDGSGDPQLATISGTSNQIDVTNGAASITLSLSSSYVGQTSITTLGTIATGTWEGTDIGVAHGGTGVSTLTDGGILLGSGTGAITALGVATNGQIPIGDGSGDPQLATISGTSNQIDVTNGAGSITLALSSSYVGQTSITTLGTIATGTWQGSNIGVPYGGTGNNSFTDNTLLMGNGTSALSLVTGVYGSDSAAILKIEGAAATLQLTETATDPDESWQLKTLESSGDSYLQLQRPSGGTALSFHKNGYQVAYADGVNAYYYNAAGSTEHLRLGSSGVSFDGGSNYLDDYEEGTYTAYLYGDTTGNTGDSTYRITGTVGHYCKIGRLVFVHFRFDNFTVPTNATGHLSITVPFTCNLADVGGAPMMNLMNISTNCTYSIVYCNGDHFRIYSIGDDVGWSLNSITDTSGAGRYVWASFTYYTDS